MITIGKPQQPKATAATIVAVDTGGYRVQDDAGRITRAASVTVWPVGARVMVLAGQIIGRAGRAAVRKIYEV
jgi:hypothetical protein